MRKISKTKIKRRSEKKTDPELKRLFLYLNKQPKPIWHQVAKYLARPRRKSIKVNIDKINRLTKQDDVIVVPGKVLGKGSLDHKLTVSAFRFSEKAKEKLSKKADLLTIQELAEKTSQFKGINLRIII